MSLRFGLKEESNFTFNHLLLNAPETKFLEKRLIKNQDCGAFVNLLRK